jgi:hypothetical protein
MALAGLGLGCALAVVLEATAGGAQSAQTYKGLEMTPRSVARSRNVSLQDCPPGENIVRGVIRPTENTEFATVEIDFKVLPSFEAVELDKPVLYDAAGEAYKTAQSFGELNAQPSYSCRFSFRVPKGTELSRIEVGEASLDLTGLGK